MTVQLIQFFPSLQSLQSFFQNTALRGLSTLILVKMDDCETGGNFKKKHLIIHPNENVF